MQKSYFTDFSKKAMDQNIDKILVPSLGIDIVFNLSSLTPSSKPSIIYDVDHTRQTVIVAQPIIPIHPGTEKREVHLTMLIKDKGSKKRIGIKCRPVKFHKDYKLSNTTTVGAVTFEYEPKIIETNIRAAFRLTLVKKHAIRAKIVSGGGNYYSTQHFFFKDISLGGVAMVIPKNIDNRRNPLARIKPKEQMPFGIIIIGENANQPNIAIPSIIEILRVNTTYTETSILAGARFVKFSKPESEDKLNRFIHKSQMEDLKRLSGI